MKKEERKKRGQINPIPAPFIVIVITFILIIAAAARYFYQVTFPMIHIKDGKAAYFYIHTGAGFEAVKDSLVKGGFLEDPEMFEWLSKRKHYDSHVKPGRYRLIDDMSNNLLVNTLRSGRQEPVQVVIQNIRTTTDLAQRLARKLEPGADQLMAVFTDQGILARYNVSAPTLLVLFIPNTYEFYWNSTPIQILDRMKQEYRKFWNETRRMKADSLHLRIDQIVTLASIVEKESNKNDEKPVIAGVYLNRLRIGMPLQADPTLIFAWNDYTIKRVMKKHTEIKSPYNTYLHTGLPPGPICLPSMASIDAVLKAGKHNFLYFCAKEDLSGYHNFATDLIGHTINARKYQRALNKLNIK